MLTYSLFDDFSTNFLSPLLRSCRIILSSFADDEKSVTQQIKQNQRVFSAILFSFNILYMINSVANLCLFIYNNSSSACEDLSSVQNNIPITT